MTVEVHLYSQSAPVVVPAAVNAYTKDGLYCILQRSGITTKFPVRHIFRIREKP
jgi:hypothetical protein